MTWKSFVKDFYNDQIYTDLDVAGFVKNGQITSSDYKDITGKEYEASTE
ncbi:XkdX family protein [Fructilactobacillus fructivorans]|uniref:XkdX family protein n=1 Tax=Fructilactobacillus fructivorans TaxID=1614 RepID=A0AAE6P1A5_9LACO|nr:XkdX family protein [Fructilactobacillus fructivorans]QFX92523.1 XkdX family protein [Fructilactobacillus fructivorans]RDV65882.1 XkdX family protein [Fructilactobacillus fructivorans]